MKTLEHQGLKPHISFAEQLQRLKARGLSVSDDGAATQVLERLGYYRLSGYLYALRQTHPVGKPGRLDRFVEGATLDLVVKLAEFDKRLRLLSLYAIETIEVAVRVAIAHRLGRLHPEAHRLGHYLDGRFVAPARDGGLSEHERWLARFDELSRQSKEDFMDHHRRHYGGRVPIWVGTEIWDFGQLSRFFAGLKFRDRVAIASLYGLHGGDVLPSWLRAFNFVRNVAAHHSRLWNRVNPAMPALPPLEHCRWLACLHAAPESRERMFGALTCMRLMLRSISPLSDWHQLIKQLTSSFPHTDLLSLQSAGFSSGWEEFPIWR